MLPPVAQAMWVEAFFSGANSDSRTVSTGPYMPARALGSR